MATTIIYETTDVQEVDVHSEEEFLQTAHLLEDCGLPYLSQNESGQVLYAEMNISGGYSYTHC